MRQQKLEAEVVVVGGGLAGVSASLAAARNGASVLLVQDRPVLGGNTSSEINVHAGGADQDGHRPHAREAGIIEELRLEDAVRDPRAVPVMWDLTLYNAIRQEPRITLLLNTAVRGAKVVDGKIVAIEALRTSTDEGFEIEAPVFIDTSGDGWLGYFAGADFRQGREGPDEHGEPHAQGPDNITLGASLMFLAQDTGKPVDFTPPSWAKCFPECEPLAKRWRHPELDRHGFWWNELGGTFDLTRDTEQVRDELLATLLGLWDHIKNHCPKCAEKARTWELTWFGWLPGKRETRRLLGDHIMTEADVVEARLFEDRVAHGGWPIDLHPPWGVYDDAPPATMIELPDMYSIPLRALYSRNVGNLLFAGRCISSTHVAFGTTRLAATGAAMGQAVGTAAAMCAKRAVGPRQVAERHVRELQELLMRQDQYILDLAAEDAADLARTAKVTATSEAEGAEAENVVNGVTRWRKGESNQWASADGAALPQGIELKWAEAKAVRELHFTFDSGFERGLSHTQYPYSLERQVRGPQPETVRDVRIEAWIDGAWRFVAAVKGNYQRKRVVRLKDAVKAEAVRAVVEATNGDERAKVFEIRAYE